MANKNKIVLLAITVIFFSFTGCTDTAKAKRASYGKEHIIELYSGSELIDCWTSTGKVNTLTDSDGWEFKDKTTGKLIRVSGTVVIRVK